MPLWYLSDLHRDFYRDSCMVVLGCEENELVIIYPKLLHVWHEVNVWSKACSHLLEIARKLSQCQTVSSAHKAVQIFIVKASKPGPHCWSTVTVRTPCAEVYESQYMSWPAVSIVLHYDRYARPVIGWTPVNTSCSENSLCRSQNDHSFCPPCA